MVTPSLNRIAGLRARLLLEIDLKVRANLPEGSFGFYGEQRRFNGDEFDIPDGEPLGSWMEAIEEERPKRRGRPKKTEEPVEDDVPSAEE